MLDKMGIILSVETVLLIGRPVGNIKILVNVGKIDCKVEVTPDRIGTVPMSISKKKPGIVKYQQ